MKPLQFKIQNIKILRSEVREYPFMFEKDFSLEDVDMDVGSTFNYSENYFHNFMHFRFFTKQNEKEISLGHFDFMFTFDVKDLMENIIDEEFKRLLYLSVLSITYSTARGMIFSETKGFSINTCYVNPISGQMLYNKLVGEKKINDIS